MSNHEDERPAGIADEDLPEELQPSDDNPLAKPLEEGDDTRSPEELDVLGGKEPEQSHDQTPDQTAEEQSDEDDAASGAE
jgi:hypothetical protein